MPIYEYECEKCGNKFEERRSVKDCDAELKCPKCGEHDTKRVFTAASTAILGSCSASFGST